MANVEPRTFSFEEAIQQLHGGRLRVPRFQRQFVWNREQVLQLFESIRLRYPIGSLLIWRTPQRYSSFDRIGAIAVSVDAPAAPAEVSYVLDGHQRLSTLFGVLALSEEHASQLHGSQRIFLVYFDLDTGKFVHARNPTDVQLPLRFLLAKDEKDDRFTQWMDERRDKTKPNTAERAAWDRRRRLAQQLQTTFAQYRLPYVDVTDADLKEAVNIFSRLNSQGSVIRRADVFAALSWSDGAFDFTAEARRLLEAFPSFTNFGTEPILRALLASLEEDIYANDWEDVLQRHRDVIPARMEEVRVAFGRATDFLAADLGALSGRVVPYALHLVLLTEYFRVAVGDDPDAREQLQRWIWASSFSASYSLGSSRSFNDAVTRARRLARGERLTLFDGRPQLRAFPRQFHPKSARVRAFHLFLKQLQPLDLRTGRRIDPDQLLRNGMADARPVATTGKNGWRMASRLLVGARTGDLRESLLATSRSLFREEILRSHALPLEALDALLCGDEAEFLRRREQELIQREREFAAQYVEIPTDPAELVEEDAEIDVEEDPIDNI